MRTWLRKLIKVRDTPEAIARGLAVGFFFGVSLLWGLQLVLAVLGAHLIRGNKVIAGAMTAISNPLTNLPLYGICYFVGARLVGGMHPIPDLGQLRTLEGFLQLGPGFLLRIAVGTTVVGLVGAVILYFSSRRIIAGAQKRAARRPFTRARVDAARA